jgi:FTR1 family protein
MAARFKAAMDEDFGTPDAVAVLFELASEVNRSQSAERSGLLKALGGLLGLIAAVIIGWLMFDTAIKLNLRRFFQLTSIVLIVFAAGLAGHAIHEFNELGWIPAVVEHVYDLNAIVTRLKTVFWFYSSLSISFCQASLLKASFSPS